MTAIDLSLVIQYLQDRYPLRLAEPWDNVGLLVGNPEQTVERVMTCLTVTPQICQEAIEKRADLIVTHHPFPFHPLKTITTETVRGRMIWDIITNKIAVYSPHTAHDSAADGINQQIAKRLGLQQITTLFDDKNEGSISNEGTGRIGMLPETMTFRELIEKTKEVFAQRVVPFIGPLEKEVKTVAVACGTAGAFLGQAKLRGADVFLVGESKYHVFLEAQFSNISLIVPGHYATERFAMERMAELIQTKFPDIISWVSSVENDPVSYAF